MSGAVQDDELNEAARWYARIAQGPLSGEEGHAFDCWVSAPAHLAAFSKISETWDELQSIADTAPVEALRQESRSAVAPAGARAWPPGALSAANEQDDGLAVEHESLSKPRAIRRSFIFGGAIMALAASAAMLLLPVPGPGLGPLDIATAQGERRTTTLADGSTVTLDGSSRVIVSGETGSRSLELESGRALFRVQADRRPFIVRSGQISVTATGTLFSVERLSDHVQIELYEGGILVQSATHRLDQAINPVSRLVIYDSNQRPLLLALNDSRGQSWVDGELVLVNETLGLAAERMNRMSTQRIEVDPAVSTLRISGVFGAGEVDGLVDAITSLLDVDARASAESIRLVARRQSHTEQPES